LITAISDWSAQTPIQAVGHWAARSSGKLSAAASPQVQGSRLIAHPLELVVAIQLYLDGKRCSTIASSLTWSIVILEHSHYLIAFSPAPPPFPAAPHPVTSIRSSSNFSSELLPPAAVVTTPIPAVVVALV
jgi:hypothetical protein